MKTRWRALALFALAIGSQCGVCQSLVYVEAGVAACPTLPVAAAAKTVSRGAPVSGGIRVGCGFTEGSYTVTLNSTDPDATLSPKSFLVNFGRLVGNGTYTVRFSTVGLHTVSAAITSNMGSPAVKGHFAGAGNEFNVVQP